MQYIIGGQISDSALMRVDNTTSKISYSIDGATWTAVTVGETYTAGSGITITNKAIAVDMNAVQAKLTKGTGITFTGNTISVDTSVIQPTIKKGTGITLSGSTVGVDFSAVQKKLIAGTGISISADGTITSTGRYDVGWGIQESGGTIYLDDSVFGKGGFGLYDYDEKIGIVETGDGISLDRDGYLQFDYTFGDGLYLNSGNEVELDEDFMGKGGLEIYYDSYHGENRLGINQTGAGIFFDSNGYLTTVQETYRATNVSGTYTVYPSNGTRQCLILSGNADIRFQSSYYKMPVAVEIRASQDYQIKLMGNTTASTKGIYTTTFMVIDSTKCATPLTKMVCEA